MTNNKNQTSVDLSELIRNRRPGFSLPAAFYRAPQIFHADMQQIFFRHWLYAGHASQLPEVGSYFLFELGGESVIIVRDKQQTIRAFVNVCRHRGSRICRETAGKVAAFVCPYHAWTYGLDGALRSRRSMPADFNPADYSLHELQCETYHGLIFVNFAADAPPLHERLHKLDAGLAIYDLANTRVAHREIYRVRANWKLGVENFMECYHCAPAHAEYARCHTLQSPQDYAKHSAAMRREAAALGYKTATAGTMAGDGAPYYYGRHALYPPFVTGSRDGKALAPLLGEIAEYGGGAADVQFAAVCFGLLYPDHAILYSFAPRDVQQTDMEVVWLVRAEAEAGRDYDSDELTWLWRVTSEADQRIIEDNQSGVNSRFYSPGPFAEMEAYTEDFIRWYLRAVGSF